MAISLNKVIGIGVALLIVAVIMPIALAQIYTGGFTMTAASVDSTVITVFQVLLPIVAVIGIIIYFVPRGNK